MPDFKILLITPQSIGRPDLFYLKVEEALSNGIRAIQYRNKQLSKREAYAICLRLREITSRYKATFIVNDEIDLALASNADGIHIGQEDFPLSWTRKIIGPDKIVGVSTHNLEQALQAEKGGANYIGFGAIFPTNTKEKAVEVGLSALERISHVISIPIIAIGGISPENIASVFSSGASVAAVISAVWDQDNIKSAVDRLNMEASRVTAGAKSPKIKAN